MAFWSVSSFLDFFSFTISCEECSQQKGSVQCCILSPRELVHLTEVESVLKHIQAMDQTLQLERTRTTVAWHFKLLFYFARLNIPAPALTGWAANRCVRDHTLYFLRSTCCK